MPKKKSESQDHGDTLSKYFKDGKVSLSLSRKVQIVQYEPIQVNVMFEGELVEIAQVEEALDSIWELLLDQMDARLEDMADLIEEEMQSGSSRSN